MRIDLILFFLFVLSACGTRPKPQEPTTIIEMDPLLISDQETIHAQTLFDEGTGALEGQLFDLCIEKFNKLIRFKDHPYLQASYYNLGLCYEFKKDFINSENAFKNYLMIAKGESDILDGKVRLGYSLLQNYKADEALILYDDVLKKVFKPLDRAECHLRRAIAYLLKKDFSRADHELSVAISQTTGVFVNGFEGNELMAEIYFQRAEIYKAISNQFELKMPLERMKRAFSDKVRFFRKALYAYVSCIQVHHSYWGLAAGFQLAKMHEDVYYQIIHAEKPDDFDEETTLIYRHQLKKRIFPLLQESVSIYQKNAELGQRIGAQHEWVKATQEKLSELHLMIQKIQEEINKDPLETYQKDQGQNQSQKIQELRSIEQIQTPKEDESQLKLN
jgi:tetratricopeptide (TPR) repeat protein